MKILTICLLCLVLVSYVSMIFYNNRSEVKNNTTESYQGPVPQGYSLEHFRKTGETIMEEIE